jgi:2-methylisocitrate lyase-like PEP mutase family enzyme
MTSQQEKAERFHALHQGSDVLILANAWDVASAVIVADAGAPAVATTSAGVAWGLGAPDGHQLNRDLAVELIARIARAVDVPVTADIENGYANDASGVGETARMVIEAGAVGINLEDGTPSGLLEIEDHAARIDAARSAASASGVSLFINARTDTYLRRDGDDASRMDRTVERAGAYVAAGADGIFVPGVTDLETVAALVKEIDAPLNIMVGPGAPLIPELASLGVARVSAGAAIAMAAYGVVHRSAAELFSTGGYEALADLFPYPKLNKLVQ